jgi:periplasmic divalent cation tolerance protein
MPSAANRAIVALVMTGSEEQAVTIARALVVERLAACVNLVAPVRSIYRWHKKIEDTSEWMLVIKTRASRFVEIERRVRQLHSYEVPEVIAIPVAAGSRPYLDWLFDATGPERKQRRRAA